MNCASGLPPKTCARRYTGYGGIDRYGMEYDGYGGYSNYGRYGMGGYGGMDRTMYDDCHPMSYDQSFQRRLNQMSASGGRYMPRGMYNYGRD